MAEVGGRDSFVWRLDARPLHIYIYIYIYIYMYMYMYMYMYICTCICTCICIIMYMYMYMARPRVWSCTGAQSCAITQRLKGAGRDSVEGIYMYICIRTYVYTYMYNVYLSLSLSIYIYIYKVEGMYIRRFGRRDDCLCVQSISEISSCFFGPRLWHIEIRHRVKKTSTINLFEFETLKLCTPGFFNFNLRIFNLRVSNPNKLIVDDLFTRCRISMCQGLGPKKHDEISEIDHKGWTSPERVGFPQKLKQASF